MREGECGAHPSWCGAGRWGDAGPGPIKPRGTSHAVPPCDLGEVRQHLGEVELGAVEVRLPRHAVIHKGGLQSTHTHTHTHTDIHTRTHTQRRRRRR